jgi:hypothetical protein
MVEKDRMRFTRIRSPQNNEVGLFNFRVGAGAASRAKNCRQTGDARRVSSAITAIDIVTPDHHARELLHHVVHFVRCFRATEQPKGLWPMSINCRLETRSSAS